MSHKVSENALNRRGFLKTAAATAAAAAAAPSAGAIDFIDPAPFEDASGFSASHFGAFRPLLTHGKFEALEPFEKDGHPSTLLRALPDRIYSSARIKRPCVRKSFLEKGHRADPKKRGREEFVEVSWEQAAALVASEIKRVQKDFGPDAIYGGSYGWYCAGNVNNPQALLYRFLNITGGFTTRALNYSCHCISAITPHITGMDEASAKQTSWDNVLANSELIITWSADILNTHRVSTQVPTNESQKYVEKLRDKVAAGQIEVINIDPVRNDTARFLGAKQIFIRPITDVALMLALMHELLATGKADLKFLKKYTVGSKKLIAYITDEAAPKSPEWAQNITGVSAAQIKALAAKMAAKRTMIMAGWGFQRAHHGEQTHWALIALACMLGQIGTPGGGYGFNYHRTGGLNIPGAVYVNPASVNQAARKETNEFAGFPGLGAISAMPATDGPWKSRENEIIPVSRVVTMLENPGKEYDFNGKRKVYPRTELIYWAGGNPYHHHQDFKRMKKAFERVSTFIVQDCFWTASAKMADIVLPANTELERDDIAKADTNKYIFAIKKAIEPLYESKSDYEIFRLILSHFTPEQKFAFDEGRSDLDWVKYFYEQSREKAAAGGIKMPPFEEFWRRGWVEFSAPKDAGKFIKMKDFIDDPITNRLGTPSGKIELFSNKIDKFAYDDCIGHPAWYEPDEWAGNAKAGQLSLVSPHPKYRLHSQLDDTFIQRYAQVRGHEAVWVNPRDAAAAGVANGELVELYNERGSVICGALVTEHVAPGVLRLCEGAWYEPDERGNCLHGSANVLIADVQSSKLGCGNQANANVSIRPYKGDAGAPARVYLPPKIAKK